MSVTGTETELTWRQWAGPWSIPYRAFRNRCGPAAHYRVLGARTKSCRSFEVKDWWSVVLDSVLFLLSDSLYCSIEFIEVDCIDLWYIIYSFLIIYL